jgi:hypothetical protein
MHSADDALVFYLPAEAAKILRCSEWWIKEQARKGLIPHCWIGGGYKFTPEHLKAIARIYERGNSGFEPAHESQPTARRSANRKSRHASNTPSESSESVQLTARVPPRARRASGGPEAA